MSSCPDQTPPDAGDLYQAALRHLGRYAVTEAGLRRVLTRRIERWARGQGDLQGLEQAVQSARTAVDKVVARLVKAGAVSDVAFAESRARSLVRSGQSMRSIQARLAAKGVSADVARAASDTDADTELGAALVLVRKRRIGPYRAIGDVEAGVRMKEMAILARAGFSREVAQTALKMSHEEAELRIFRLRQ